MATLANPIQPLDPLSAVELVLPEGHALRQLFDQPPLLPFSAAATDFIATLGRQLREDPAARRFPELVALGFWARTATVQRLKDRFEAQYPGAVRLARGLAFHIAPSNVDTIFVYSLLLSLLAGNRNLVRVSSRSGDQAGTLVGVLARALETAAPEIQQAVAIVRYGHDKAITDALSAAADLRVVWGGDATVKLIRQSPLAPLGTELVFPNRHSLAVFAADSWNASPDRAGLARRFVNDALWFGQMACSSPRDLVFVGQGEACAKAAASFWPEVEAAAEAASLDWADASAVSKLVAAQDLAIEADRHGEPVHLHHARTNWITVVDRPTLATLGSAGEVGNGFFNAYRADSVADVLAHSQRHWQTIVSLGIDADEWAAALRQSRGKGVSRIVKVGSALDFDAIWDGIDLLTGMTRLVSIAP